MFVKGCDLVVCVFDKKFGMKDVFNIEEDIVFVLKINSDVVKYFYISFEIFGKDEWCLFGGFDSFVGIFNLRVGDE